MKKVLLLVVFWVIVATKLWAQPLMYGDVPLRDIYYSANVNIASSDPINSGSQSSTRGADKKFWALVAAQHVAMVWDGNSALRAIDRCYTAGRTSCRDANPFVGMYIEKGGSTAYIAGTMTEAGLDMLALVMKRSDNRIARRAWFVIPLALTVMHTKGIIMNERSFRPGIISSIRLEDLNKK